MNGDSNPNDAGNSKAKLVLAVLALVAAAVLLYLFFPAGRPGVADPDKQQAFYSVDDGATWFADAESKLAPFDHDGKQAVRAYVYQCDGKQFVAYVERYTKEGLAAAEAKKSGSGYRPDARTINLLTAKGREVKRPGDAKWVNKSDRAASALLTPKCPGGDGTPAAVTP